MICGPRTRISPVSGSIFTSDPGAGRPTVPNTKSCGRLIDTNGLVSVRP
jgi:hypothetical protein